MTQQNIGFIGTGIMGLPMATHLIKSGHLLKVWNRTPGKLGTLIQAGAAPCETPQEVAKDSNVVICMLSDGQTCDTVLLGAKGVLAAMSPGATLIVMSSIPVETAIVQSQVAASYGVAYLDAPVSGGEKGAKAASLAIMAGGDSATFADVENVLACMGRPVHVGPAGTGELAKLVNQLIVASTIAAVSEALLLAEQGGADPAKVREALSGGFADSPILQQHGQRMLSNDFAPGGPAKWQLKDTRTALAYAAELGLDLPVAKLVDGLFESMVFAGDGELDHSGLIRQLRRHNGLTEA
ncbi:NAD(P)-dependent oxidoreductase [Pseudomonas fluorescens]|jgi:3-hydroxyisobutyrate dehydrogenase-like beta-hydroxyacid dehydrogenase|uniref:NAD(P)-dependent oxidoreductase n=1 Tax=Pseudomonas fluorescens TaxID=294 RepID=UPI003D089F61